MIYTKQEKQKLDRVISVFAERLRESDAFDLVWSGKVGYVPQERTAGWLIKQKQPSHYFEKGCIK